MTGAPGITFGVDLGFATSASTWAFLRQPSPAPQLCLAKPRHMSFLSVSRLPFASPETLPQSPKRFLAALATFLDTALPCKALWPHFWTQPCLAKRRHISFLSVSRVPFASLETPPQPRKRFLAALATYLDTALPCKALWPHFWTQPCHAKRRHLSFLSVSRLPFASLETPPQPNKRFSAALDTYLDTALPCNAPSPVLS